MKNWIPYLLIILLAEDLDIVKKEMMSAIKDMDNKWIKDNIPKKEFELSYDEAIYEYEEDSKSLLKKLRFKEYGTIVDNIGLLLRIIHPYNLDDLVHKEKMDELLKKIKDFNDYLIIE